MLSVFDALFAEKSLVLSYWKVLLSIVVISITWLYARKLQHPKETPTTTEQAISLSLDGAEYIGGKLKMKFHLKRILIKYYCSA